MPVVCTLYSSSSSSSSGGGGMVIIRFLLPPAALQKPLGPTTTTTTTTTSPSRLHSLSLSLCIPPLRLLRSLFLHIFDLLYSFIYFFVLTGGFLSVYDRYAEALLPSWLVVVAYSLLHTYYYYHCY